MHLLPHPHGAKWFGRKEADRAVRKSRSPDHGHWRVWIREEKHIFSLMEGEWIRRLFPGKHK